MNIPEDRMYNKSHEWVQFLTDDTCRVGISDYAQNAMGDIVFINLPATGDQLSAGDALCDLESVKAVSDVYSPVDGTVQLVNGELDDAPELLNTAPYEAWIAELTDVIKGEGLMDAAAYRAHCELEEQA